MAEHLLTRTKVALKILNKLEIEQKGSFKAVNREIQILNSVSHPNVIRLYDVIETSTSLVLVLEYMSGGELYNIVESHKISEHQAKDFFRQILMGIEQVHRKGFAHRDIKPENILLDASGAVKIGDFGLGNGLFDGRFLKTRCGSPNYAAPEVILGEKYCGTEVDIWSLGVVLYALNSNTLPFDDPSIPVTFNLIKQGRYRVPSYFSEELKDLIARMLCVDPLMRISLSQIKEHPWLRNHPGYALNRVQTDYVSKLYSDRGTVKLVIRACLQIPEYSWMTQKQAKDVIKTFYLDQGKFKYPGGNGRNQGFISTFLILLDQQVKMEKKTVQKTFDIEKKVLFKDLSQKCSKKTSASSITSETCEKLSPNNWVYGFRSTLEFSFLAVKLFEGLKNLGIEWKFTSKSSCCLKSSEVEVFLQVFRFDETYVLDLTLKKGKIFEFFEVASSIYTIIFRITYNIEEARN